MKTKLFLLLYFLLTVLCSCGDILASRKNIVGRYYLVEDEGSNAFSIRYKLATGDFIGRVPAPVVEYGWNDSVLVVKTMCEPGNEVYVIDMRKDFEFADKSEYLIRVLSEVEYNRNWQDQLKLKFERSEYR